jgi:hypothetical protein
MNIHDIINQVKDEPDILSTLDVEELLENAENLDKRDLEGKTMHYFMNETFSILKDIDLDENDIQYMYDKLKDYHYVERICDLRVGRYIRWINMSNKTKLTKGGAIVRIDILDNETSVLCRNYKYITRFNLDNCWIFQKFTVEEQLFMMLQEK